MSDGKNTAVKTLLRVRSMAEGNSRRQCVKAMTDVDSATAELALLRRAQRMHRAGLRSTLDGDGDPMNVRLYSQCLRDLEDAIACQRKRLDAARRVLARRRRELSDSMRQRRRVEVLRERAAVAEAAVQRGREQRQADELHGSYRAVNEQTKDRADG
jgi:flagellar export protein FliJ